MADLKCRVHGRQAPTATLCPTCMEFLVPDVPDTVVGPLDVGSGVSAVDTGPPRSDGHGVQPDRADAPRTTRDNVRGLFVLEFPWGAMPVGETRLRIGRSYDLGSIAKELAHYDNVGRHHAEVWTGDGALQVMDLGSTNGTFLNDRRLEPRVAQAAYYGDLLRFAADLRARVSDPRRSA